MDRNYKVCQFACAGRLVALRKESVDRNHIRHTTSARPSIVALRKESVDRNYIIKITEIWGAASLSARRAWIEIAMTGQISVSTVSLSARRAWIEI